MPPSSKKKSPSFWPQALWILAPVCLLTYLALETLWQDRERALQEAIRLAQGVTDRMARLTAAEFRELADEYQQATTAWFTTEQQNLGLEPLGLLSFSERDDSREIIANWQRSEPDIPLDGQPMADLFYRGNELLSPKDETATRNPPAWFRELEPALLSLWHGAQASATTSPSEAREKWARIRQLAQDSAVQKAAELELLLLQESPGTDREWHQQLAAFNALHSDWTTETGTTFEARILAARVFANPSLEPDTELVRDLARQAIRSPNMVTDRLIQNLTARAARSNPNTRLAQSSLVRIWGSQNRARSLFRSYQALPAVDREAGCPQLELDGRRYSFWKAGELPEPGLNLTGARADLVVRVRLIPESLVRSAIDRGRIRLGNSPPGYARFEILAAGKSVPPNASSLIPPDMATPKGAKHTVLSETTIAWGDSRFQNPPTFTVRLLLISPQELYQQAKSRSLLFGGLILGSALVSLLGLWSARSAFLKQHHLAELKGSFVSSISHELRTPIASVRLLAESLQRGTIREPEKQQEYFGWIVQECRRLTALIENVLDFARIDQGRKVYEFEPTDLRSLIDDTIRSVQPVASEKGVQLKTIGTASQGSDKDLNPVWDGRAVQQAIINLLDNALKHAPSGSTVTLGIEPQETQGRIRLWVQDEGRGIPSEDHQRIFELFFRRGTELRRETQGIGIGLAIVRHVVEGHGGRILVESQPGQGARFTMEMPMDAQTSSKKRASSE